MYLQVTLPQYADYVDFVGLRLIKNVEIEIGGQRVDKHYSDWMYIWNQLSLPTGKQTGYNKMVGATPSDLNVTGGKTLYVPLEFWFCRNVGLALPLIALIARAEKHHPQELRSSCDKMIYGSVVYNNTTQGASLGFPKRQTQTVRRLPKAIKGRWKNNVASVK
jgi:hypothetical protein